MVRRGGAQWRVTATSPPRFAKREPPRCPRVLEARYWAVVNHLKASYGTDYARDEARAIVQAQIAVEADRLHEVLNDIHRRAEQDSRA